MILGMNPMGRLRLRFPFIYWPINNIYHWLTYTNPIDKFNEENTTFYRNLTHSFTKCFRNTFILFTIHQYYVCMKTSRPNETDSKFYKILRIRRWKKITFRYIHLCDCFVVSFFFLIFFFFFFSFHSFESNETSVTRET